MEYKGYTARVVFDQEAGVLFGEVEGLRDIVTFEAENVADLETAFHESVDDYLDMCAEKGEEPEKPYSGKFLMRLDPLLHRDVSMAAASEGKSLNAFAAELLKQYVESKKRARSTAPKERRAKSLVAARPSSFANARGFNEPAALAGPANAIAQDASANGFGLPQQSKHTPGSITPSSSSQTPTASRTPSAQGRGSKAA